MTTRLAANAAVRALVAAWPVDHPVPATLTDAAAEAVALSAPADEPFVTYVCDGSAAAGAVAAVCASAGFEPRVRMEVRETAALVAFVAAGIGVALVPAGVQNVRIPGVVYLPLREVQGPSLPTIWESWPCTRRCSRWCRQPSSHPTSPSTGRRSSRSWPAS